MLEKIRDISLEKLNSSGNAPKYALINDLLKDDNCFFKMDIATALNILKDLGYTDKEATDIYLQLIKK